MTAVAVNATVIVPVAAGIYFLTYRCPDVNSPQRAAARRVAMYE